MRNRTLIDSHIHEYRRGTFDDHVSGLFYSTSGQTSSLIVSQVYMKRIVIGDWTNFIEITDTFGLFRRVRAVNHNIQRSALKKLSTYFINKVINAAWDNLS